MGFRQISQRYWVKGLSAASSDLNQQPGILARISNLIYERRGSLKTCGGTGYISKHNAAVQVGEDPWTCIAWFNPVGIVPYFVGIKKDTTTHIGVPADLAVTDGGAGGTLLADTYYYQVSALDGAGGETLACTEVSIVNIGSHKNHLSWTTNSIATGYNIYRRALSGGTQQLYLRNNITTTWDDDGSTIHVIPTVAPPLTDTTQTCLFYQIPSGSYTAGEIKATLPADNLPYDDGTGDGGGGSGGGGGTGTGTGGTTATGSTVGGVSGNCSPIPQMVQFTDKMILCLGNGLTPKTWNGTSVATISNTFVSAYPSWLTAITQLLNDYVKPTAPNGHIYKCVQGGKTGGVEPSWPTTTDQSIADGSVIWKEAGADSAGASPRGASHGIVHAGALWVFNTGVTNSADLMDGPSMLRMSDINNPLSWNPINRAYIGKDDGSQGMGLATFSIAEVGIPPTAALIAFKEFSTYVINGVFGSQNFSIQQAQTDLGCVAPRSIQFVPGFGIIRLTHLGVAIFDGVRDRIISEEIRPYLFGGVSDITQIDWSYAYFSKGTQTSSPPMYELAIPLTGNLGKLTRILRYDLVLKAWTIVDLPFPISTINQIRATGTIPITAVGGFSDGTLRRLQSGDTDWDGTAISWSFRTAEVFGASASDRTYFRRLLIRGLSSPLPTINCVVTLDGADQPSQTARMISLGSSGQWQAEITIAQTALNAHATISGSGVATIEEVQWSVVAKSTSIPARAT